MFFFFHIHTAHLDIIKVFYSPTDAQVNCLKNIFKIYIKINIKTAPTCFGAVTPPSRSALLVLLAILTTVTLASTSNALPEDGVTVPKYVGAVLLLILM
jgi:hypothetical protein